MTSTGILDRPPRPAPPLPPVDDGGRDDGFGGGGNDGFGSSGPPFSVSRIGLFILIGSIVMLFAGFLTVYMILRYSSPEWPPKTLPPLPAGLWISTAIIVLSSFTAQRFRTAVDRAGPLTTKRWIAATFALGGAFCAVQGFCWQHVYERGLDLRSSQYAASFYCLTAVHFVHILGGLFYLALGYHGVANRWSAEESARAAIRDRLANGAIYWHFVGGLWYLLFAILYLF